MNIKHETFNPTLIHGKTDDALTLYGLIYQDK
jgi:hypothetical protein